MHTFKKIFLFSLLIITPFYTNKAETPAQPGGMLPMPTEQELKEIEEFLSTLSPEELDELAQLGQEIIDTAEKEGVPVFGPPPAPTSSKPTQPKKPEPSKPTASKKPKLEKEVNLSGVAELRKMLFRLIDSLDSIRQKSSRDQELEDTFSPLDEKMNLFLYYLYVINDNKVAAHLKDKEFSKLKDDLKKLDRDLYILDDDYEVPQLDHTKETKNTHLKNKLKHAQILLKKVIQRLEKAFLHENIIDELLKLIKKYEPEALKTKKELEAKEKSAHDAIKKQPVTNTGSTKQGSLASPFRQAGSPYPPARGSAMPTLTPTKPPTPSLKGLGTTQQTPSSTPKQPAKNFGTPKQKVNDLSNSIKSDLEKIESALSSHYLTIDNFLSGYRSQSEPSAVSGPLGEANFALKKLKKQTTKWYKQATEEAVTAHDFANKTRDVKTFYYSSKTSRLHDLHKRIKAITDRKTTLKGAVKKFKELMDDLEKKVDGTL